MLDFKTYVESKNKINWDSNYIFKLKSHYIINTNHAIERTEIRNVLDDDQLAEFFKKIIKGFLKKGDEYINNDGIYLIYSKSFDQAVVVNYRHDIEKINNKRHFIVITFLEKGKKCPLKGTEKVITESHQKVNDDFSNACNYLQRISKNVLTESNGIQELSIPELQDNHLAFKTICVENKIWSYEASFEIIEV